MPGPSAAAAHAHALTDASSTVHRHGPTARAAAAAAASMRRFRFGHAMAHAPGASSLALLARPAATTAATASSAHSAAAYTDRHVIQSELHTMSLEQLLRFDNSSGITIYAIITVVCALGGVFILCLVLAAILSWTNAPRHEAFPYAQEAAGQPPLYQPSASAARTTSAKRVSGSDGDESSLADAAGASLAGGTAEHSRTGSSGLGFPGPAHASRRGPAAAQYQTRLPRRSSMNPAPAALGAVNYNGREMTINMAGPQADEGARVAAQARLERERARRSMVMGGPPPLSSTKRVSRYSRQQGMPPPSARMSSLGRSGSRMSRQPSRSSYRSTAESLETRGDRNLSSRRRTVTSTGAGMVQSFGTRRRPDGDGGYQDRRCTIGRPPPSARHDVKDIYHAAGPTVMLRSDSESMYDNTSVYDLRDPGWAAAPTSQTNLIDPLQAHGPNPFVTAHG